MKVTQTSTTSTDAPHIPTARQAPGSYTRASLDNAIANQAQDEPRPYDAVVLGFQYDRLQADNAFGGAA